MVPSTTEERAAQIADLRERARAAREEAAERRASAPALQARLDAIVPERMALVEEAGRVSAALQQTLGRAQQRETEALAYERQAATLEAQG